LRFRNYIFQSFIVFVCVSLVLFLFEFFGGIIVASIGASSFILFVTPHANGSRARYVIGGYICGSVSGVLLSFLYAYVLRLDLHYLAPVFVLAGAAALATFLMISAKLVHPPSAALALGLAADSSSIKTAAVAVLGVSILCVIRYALKKYLKNLV